MNELVNDLASEPDRTSAGEWVLRLIGVALVLAFVCGCSLLLGKWLATPLSDDAGPQPVQTNARCTIDDVRRDTAGRYGSWLVLYTDCGRLTTGAAWSETITIGRSYVFDLYEKDWRSAQVEGPGLRAVLVSVPAPAGEAL